MHVQTGIETTDGNSGLVYLRAIEAPPPADKMADVVIPKGAVKMRAVACPIRRGKPNSKWIDLEKGDLERLRTLSSPGPFVASLVGPAISGAGAILTAKTNYMRFGAICVRLYRDVPLPVAGIWSWAATFRDEFFPLFHSPPPEMEFAEWISSMPKERQAPLRKAYEVYNLSGWRKKYAKFSSFLKEELLCGVEKDDMGLIPLQNITARMIHGPHNVTHVIAGPKLKPYMKWLKKQWHHENFIFYGGTEPKFLQLWLDRFSSPCLGTRVYFWSDLSQFESSHRLETWDFMESFYQQYQHHSDFQKCLQAWKNITSKIGDFKFTGRVGVNASGRPDTAFANGVLNGVATLLAVTSAWLNKPLTSVTIADIHEIESVLLVSVCGDDTLGSVPYLAPDRAMKFAADCRQGLKDFGFKAKFFISYRLEDCVYLAHRPLCVAGKWYWAKTLGRCLYKLGYRVKISGDPQAHMLGIAQMYQKCASHVPILADIANAWCEARKHGKVNAYKADPNRPWEMMGVFGPSDYDQSTVAALARAYTVNRELGRTDLSPVCTTVTPEDVWDCIHYVREKVQGVPCVLDHWLLRHMVWVDEE